MHRKTRSTASKGITKLLGTALLVGTLGACQGAPQQSLSPVEDDGPYAGLSDVARQEATHAVQIALEKERSGNSVTWRLASAGVGGSVTPLRTFRISSGYYCREFVETLDVRGNQSRREGVACRTERGHWEEADA